MNKTFDLDRRLTALLQQWRQQAMALRFGAEDILAQEHAIRAMAKSVIYQSCAEELEAVLLASRLEENAGDLTRLDTPGSPVDSLTAATDKE